MEVAQRHKVEHGFYPVARALARWLQAHVHELIAVGRRYGLHLSDKVENSDGLLTGAREKTSELLVHYPQPWLLWLADLRRLPHTTAGVSPDCELLGQGAQAAKDTELPSWPNAATPNPSSDAVG